MLGKLLVGSGCVLGLLCARPAAAQSIEERPTAPSTAEQPAPTRSTDVHPGAVATEAKNTVLLGFEAREPESWLETDSDRDGTATGWSTLCPAPCTRRVPADARFRVVGAQAEPSAPFRLPEGRDRVIVTTTLKKSPQPVATVVTVVGFTALVAGPIVTVFGLARGLSGEDQHSEFLIAGLGMTLGGAIVATAGLVSLVAGSNDHQSVVTIAHSTGPRLALSRGFALESRGLTF